MCVGGAPAFVPICVRQYGALVKLRPVEMQQLQNLLLVSPSEMCSDIQK